MGSSHLIEPLRVASHANVDWRIAVYFKVGVTRFAMAYTHPLSVGAVWADGCHDRDYTGCTCKESNFTDSANVLGAIGFGEAEV
ncbi:hypothetical protein Acsp06_62660 [Actinomycetospora sp. NBRC 106375]|nr:hypothetical protein Acsp06_62660 [Actinomycetospora sp. NBRC 106375]